MFEEIAAFFTIEIIYLFLNIGIIPFWLVLIFFPNSKFCGFFVTSIFPYIIFGSIYIYLIYYLHSTEYNFVQNFNLYVGIEELVNLFSDQSFLIIFWIHFLAINFFCGSWIVRDSQKFSIARSFIFIPLIFTYFVGPLGLILYWIIRIFFAKKISLYE